MGCPIGWQLSHGMSHGTSRPIGSQLSHGMSHGTSRPIGSQFSRGIFHVGCPTRLPMGKQRNVEHSPVPALSLNFCPQHVKHPPKHDISPHFPPCQGVENQQPSGPAHLRNNLLRGRPSILGMLVLRVCSPATALRTYQTTRRPVTSVSTQPSQKQKDRPEHANSPHMFRYQDVENLQYSSTGHIMFLCFYEASPLLLGMRFICAFSPAKVWKTTTTRRPSTYVLRLTSPEARHRSGAC